MIVRMQVERTIIYSKLSALVNGFRALIESSLGLIILHPIDMKQYGSNIRAILQLKASGLVNGFPALIEYG